MKSISFLFFFLFKISILFSLSSLPDYSIVFVHIGKELPPYLYSALEQAREFNSHCPIYLVANEEALVECESYLTAFSIELIFIESLVKSKEHEEFLQKSQLSSLGQEGFWLYASERFLLLSELMSQYDLTNVFHLENDNMLYVDLRELLPIFTKCYSGIAGTFNNDDMCVAGFIYLSNPDVMEKLANRFMERASYQNWHTENDMGLIAGFSKLYGKKSFDYLPTVCKEYCEDNDLLKSASGSTAADKFRYCNHIDQFNSIFDAAAIGQYLGGINTIHGARRIGFVNESCVFNVSHFSYEWLLDEKLRLVPFSKYGNKSYRINNLHIHSKFLEEFRS